MGNLYPSLPSLSQQAVSTEVMPDEPGAAGADDSKKCGGLELPQNQCMTE